MYRCNNCDELFDIPKMVTETVGMIGLQPATSSYIACPHCGVDMDYEEVEKCELCGEYYEELEDGFCKSCIAETKKKFLQVINEEFDENEQEILEYLYSVEDLW